MNKDIILNTSEIADFFRVSTRSIQKWSDAGCPRLDRGKWNLRDVHEWWRVNIHEWKATGDEGGDETISEIRKRYWKARAEAEELHNGQFKGTLIPVVIVKNIMNRAASNVKARLLAIPTKAAAAVMGAQSLEAIREILKRHVYEALNELAVYRPEDYEGIEKTDSPKAVTTRKNRKKARITKGKKLKGDK